jgi:hypothetical protein
MDHREQVDCPQAPFFLQSNCQIPGAWPLAELLLLLASESCLIPDSLRTQHNSMGISPWNEVAHPSLRWDNPRAPHYGASLDILGGPVDQPCVTRWD